jgi:SAM-dependent methyltransferase
LPFGNKVCGSAADPSTLDSVTTHDFDKDYWRTHWSGRTAGDPERPDRAAAPHPFLEPELAGLEPGTALDAGCGEGAEAIWLASRGWQVTAVDISGEALARAAARATPRDAAGAVADRIGWVEADLSTWEPGRQFDLVTSHYAHAAISQLDLYDRLSRWVAPGGTLLLAGHLHTTRSGAHGHDDHDDHDSHPPEHATVTAATVAALLDPGEWLVVTADEGTRTVSGPAGHPVTLHDVLVRATRR